LSLGLRLPLALAPEGRYVEPSMTARYIFHLSIPVSELTTARRFYVDVLGATVGRECDEWLDILLWGHQITLQQRPEEVLPLAQQGKRHFGVVLPWAEWDREAARIDSLDIGVLESPTIQMAGTEDEQGKFYLHDPSGNVIEMKAYRNLQRTLGLAE
jgi:extradiol dioxygenase family protein